jgi:DNA-binding transcriptional ArsR family regulator
MHRLRADADVFRAIADPTRRAILDRLRAGPTPVNALAAGFAASRPSISKHLRILHQAELVAEEKRGRERLYRLRPETLAEVADWADGYRRFWNTSLEALKRHLEDKP